MPNSTDSAHGTGRATLDVLLQTQSRLQGDPPAETKKKFLKTILDLNKIVNLLVEKNRPQFVRGHCFGVCGAIESGIIKRDSVLN